jgi:hypothetical protein
MTSVNYTDLGNGTRLTAEGLPWGCSHSTGSARHLYVVCIYGAIYLQIQKYFPPDPAFFSSRSKILILLYVVSKLMQEISRFHGKTARFDVLKIKYVDISHHRYKLRRDIE